jgi:hypothetical protein
VNYPGPADAAWGVENGVVDDATAAAIAAAWSERKLTPQNTPLGSGIGFHGWASNGTAKASAGAPFVRVRGDAQQGHRELVRRRAARNDGRHFLTSEP